MTEKSNNKELSQSFADVTCGRDFMRQLVEEKMDRCLRVLKQAVGGALKGPSR